MAPPTRHRPIPVLASALAALAAATILGSTPVPARASTIGDDAKAFASMRTGKLLLTGGMLALIARDLEDPDAQERALGRGLIDAPADLGNQYGSGVTLGVGALALYGAGRLAHDDNLKGAGSEMARSLLYTTAIVTATKLAVHRTRPDGGAYSFPSGHTAVAAAVAPVLAKHFGRFAAVPAYALALGTALGRLEDRKHYLSDVTVGAAIGLSVGLAVSGTRLGPAEFGVGPAGAGVTVRF
jgi:membrane-associated phospholipid phosphatase